MRIVLLVTTVLCVACTNQPAAQDAAPASSAEEDEGYGFPIDQPNCATNRFLPECFAERVGERRGGNGGNGVDYTNGTVPN
ncbi:MAG: hypothetical protein RLO50_05710 [Azospirillaceae bacterium]